MPYLCLATRFLSITRFCIFPGVALFPPIGPVVGFALFRSFVHSHSLVPFRILLVSHCLCCWMLCPRFVGRPFLQILWQFQGFVVWPSSSFGPFSLLRLPSLVSRKLLAFFSFAPLGWLFLFCSAEELATSLFEYTFGFPEFSGRAVIVWADSLIILAALRSNELSGFDPLARKRTSTVEPESSGKSHGSNSRFGSLSKTPMNFPIAFDFTVFGSLLSCVSNGNFPSFLLLILSA